MSASAVSFQNFSFKYKAQTEPTLFDINLTIQRGEKVLIAGPSGCGKSTLGHCINGLIPNAFTGDVTGTFTVLGRNAVCQDIFARSQVVGTVLQDTDGQFVGLTAAEDIAFAAENDCVPVSSMRPLVFEAASLTQIDGHLFKPPHNLSGGQKQRVSLAGLLVSDVEILLFDEPLANLDPAAGAQTIELIDKLHHETGKTTIIIEHRLEDVLHRSIDRIIVMNKGRIIAAAPPAELLCSGELCSYGIREPLYIAALRTAQVYFEKNSALESVETIRFDCTSLRTWYEEFSEETPMQTKNEILAAQNLCFKYNEQSDSVIDDVTFSIMEGESVAIAGKNGAGKSTLAKLICGFIKPSGGSINFQGEDMSPLSIRERSERVGYVMQNPNQMISFPMIFDEAAFALRNRGINESEINERVIETLSICGLYPFRNWPVSALSYGQKKRLTIASILVTRPRILLLDEPTAGQDFRHYTEIMEFLMKLNRENGITIIMITHDMHLMLEYSSRAIVLADGRLLRTAPPAEVLTDDELVNAASLKRTSLYELSQRAGIADASVFVRRFISRDRHQRFCRSTLNEKILSSDDFICCGAFNKTGALQETREGFRHE
ncbi:MAG: ABC transporter ATP-binding protein [Spirochaetaceae bacterium]|nr:ABC transporter ATP-binding protein [Spirochaetaceae bacterium]